MASVSAKWAIANLVFGRKETGVYKSTQLLRLYTLIKQKTIKHKVTLDDLLSLVTLTLRNASHNL